MNTTAGLNITESQTIANTSAGLLNGTSGLNFSFNSFHNNVLNSKSDPWTGGCSSSIGAWLSGNGVPACAESGNQFTVTTLGYNQATICRNYCPSRPPSFVLGTTSLQPASFAGIADLNNTFVGIVTYRGAFGATDWTTGGWANWCPENEINCSGLYPPPPMFRRGVIEEVEGSSSMIIVPNPSNGVTYAHFIAEKEGVAHLKLYNTQGHLMLAVNVNIGAGEQQIPFDVSSLPDGMYVIHVQANQEEVFTQQFSVSK